MKQLTKEQKALGAFLAAMQECGHDGAKVREAMMGVLGITGEAQPAEQAKGKDVAKFFLPPALHDGIAENTAGTYRLRVTGLTIRQIKDIFEDKFLGSMMWSNGAAYPTDGVEIRFLKDQPDTTPPAENRCIRELREYAEKNPGTYIFPGWDGSRVTKYLAAAPKPQDDLPAILKKQAS